MFGFLRRARASLGTIDEALWQRTVGALPFVAARPPDEIERLRALAAEFLARKAITGAAGMEPDDAMRVSIAAQACLPVLNLGLQWYDDFVEVVVYPGEFVAPRTEVDEAGVVHEWTDVLAGESMAGGPVVLSWIDVAEAESSPWYNVVIHEFAHKLDMADGQADGCPPMPPAQARQWRRALGDAYGAFVGRLDAIEASIAHHVDPDSPAADRYYQGLVLDPYAATDPAEFFAVATELFFVDNARLRAAFPILDEAMRAFFRQNPSSIRT